MLSSGSEQLNCPGISNVQLFRSKHTLIPQTTFFLSGWVCHATPFCQAKPLFKKPHWKPLPLYLWFAMEGIAGHIAFSNTETHFQSHSILSTCNYVSSNVPSPRKLWQCLYPTVTSVLILKALHSSILKYFYTGNICCLCLSHPFPSLPPDILFSRL